MTPWIPYLLPSIDINENTFISFENYLSHLTKQIGPLFSTNKNITKILLQNIPHPQSYQHYTHIFDEVVNDEFLKALFVLLKKLCKQNDNKKTRIVSRIMYVHTCYLFEHIII